MHIDYFRLLAFGKDVVAEIVHATVFCFAFFAYRRTQKPVFLYLALASILALCLVALYIAGGLSIGWFGIPFTAWFYVASIITSILGGGSVIWLILDVWKGFKPEQKDK